MKYVVRKEKGKKRLGMNSAPCLSEPSAPQKGERADLIEEDKIK